MSSKNQGKVWDAQQKELVYVDDVKPKTKGKRMVFQAERTCLCWDCQTKMSRTQLDSSISSLRNSLIAIRQSEKKAPQNAPIDNRLLSPTPPRKLFVAQRFLFLIKLANCKSRLKSLSVFKGLFAFTITGECGFRLGPWRLG
ncbi:hypothetical protein CEXT_317131 [Caerostris extrusa]|uniref:Uncharacterized protein n=1 Tax=Caerostris extrusa TaxID=172846 RepID=A0AAV4TAG7_CAEEX|nr:hypothetical protein CEXT_317131 [Caerostris extrusa]